MDNDEDRYYSRDELPELIEDDPQFPRGQTVSVDGYAGVAWRVLHVVDARVVCRMVGDDRDFSHDRSELTVIEREEFCGECGQLGCTHDGLDRE